MIHQMRRIEATSKKLSSASAWRRVQADSLAWARAGDRLTSGSWVLFGLFGDENSVHLAVLDEDRHPSILTYACVEGRFPSVAAKHPPASRLERAIHDLYGHEAVGAVDSRSWLDHGRWDISYPLSLVPIPQTGKGAVYQFLLAEGPGLNQIPVGPVHAGVIEPGHFRFMTNGETVVRLEERLGYTHKGTERLMAGSDLSRAAHLAGRISGDSTVAYSFAFARAAEAADGLDAGSHSGRDDAVVSQGQAQGDLGRGDPVADRRHRGGEENTGYLPFRSRQRRADSRPCRSPDGQERQIPRRTV